MNKWKEILLVLFFLLMLVLPASFQIQRGILLSILIIFSLRGNNLRTIKYYTPIVYITIVNVFFSIFFFLNGIIQHAPGAYNVTSVFIFWPLLYLYFIGHLSNKDQVIKYIKCIMWGGILSAILVLLYILNTLGISSVAIPSISIAQDYSVLYEGGAFKLNGANLTTIMYCCIFCLTIVFLPSKYNTLNKQSKRLAILSLIVCLIFVFLSGRRAFWLVCGISPIIIILTFALAKINMNYGKITIITSGVIVLIGLTLSILAIDNENLKKRFITSLQFDNPDDESNQIRHEQYIALMEGWYKHPLIGSGLGASAVGSIRDDTAPWAYELSYVALLFQTGLIGILVYSLSIFWIVYKSIMLCRVDVSNAILLIPQLVALVCFLFINATNPYLAKFDYLWVIFLPIATINAILLNKKKVINV
jgi:hypothetical protein